MAAENGLARSEGGRHSSKSRSFRRGRPGCDVFNSDGAYRDSGMFACFALNPVLVGRSACVTEGDGEGSVSRASGSPRCWEHDDEREGHHLYCAQGHHRNRHRGNLLRIKPATPIPRVKQAEDPRMRPPCRGLSLPVGCDVAWHFIWRK